MIAINGKLINYSLYKYTITVLSIPFTCLKYRGSTLFFIFLCFFYEFNDKNILLLNIFFAGLNCVHNKEADTPII